MRVCYLFPSVPNAGATANGFSAGARSGLRLLGGSARYSLVSTGRGVGRVAMIAFEPAGLSGDRGG
jgi:hypothetical protein